MSKTFKAPFAQDPQSFGAVLTVSGGVNGATATLLHTAGPEGCLITALSAAPVGTVANSAGVVFFVEKAATAVKIPRKTLTVPVWDASAPANLTKALPIVDVATIAETAPMRLGRGDKLYAGLLANAAGGVAVGGEASEFKDLGVAE